MGTWFFFTLLIGALSPLILAHLVFRESDWNPDRFQNKMYFPKMAKSHFLGIHSLE